MSILSQIVNAFQTYHKEGASVTKSIESDVMELNKRQNELSIQQEQNSARWIKEQEETQNLKPIRIFNETNAVSQGVRIEGYLFKRSHQKVN